VLEDELSSGLPLMKYDWGGNNRADCYLFIVDFCLQPYCVHFMRCVVVCAGENGDQLGLLSKPKALGPKLST
jgi:hypothetical protein